MPRTTSSPRRYGIAAAFALLVIAFVAWQAFQNHRSTSKPDSPGQAQRGAPARPAPELAPVSAHTARSLGLAESSRSQASRPLTDESLPQPPSALPQVLLLDPGDISPSADWMLYVEDHDSREVGHRSRYRVEHDAEAGDLLFVDLRDEHFGPGPASAGVSAGAAAGASAWRPGWVDAKRGDLEGLVRVPVTREELSDPVPIEWFGSATVQVEWIEESPVSEEVVHLERMDPLPALLERATARHGAELLGGDFRLRDLMPRRRSKIRTLIEGAYRWQTRGGGPGLEGTIDVVRGEAQTIQVAPPPRETFTASLTVDTTLAPDSTVTGLGRCLILNVSRPLEQRLVYLRSGNAPGIWTTGEFELAAGDDCRWQVQMDPRPGAQWSERCVRITEQNPHANFSLKSSGLPYEIRVTLKSAVTAEPLKTGKVTFGRKQSWANVFKRTGGTFIFDASGTEPLYIFVACKGYEGQRLTWIPGESSFDIEVPMTPGLRERVVVTDIRTMGPAAGVPVSIGARSLGKTDEDGAVWITERETFDRPTIDAGWKVYVESGKPLAFGWTFLVAPDAGER